MSLVVIVLCVLWTNKKCLPPLYSGYFTPVDFVVEISFPTRSSDKILTKRRGREAKNGVLLFCEELEGNRGSGRKRW